MQKNIHFKINEKKTIYTTDRWSHRSLPLVTKNLANTSCQAKIKSNYKLTPQVCDDITNQGAISTVFILSTDAFGFVSRKKILNFNIQDIAWFIYRETKQTNKTHHLIKFCRTCEAKTTCLRRSLHIGKESHHTRWYWRGKRLSHPLLQSAMHLWGGGAVSPPSPPQSAAFKNEGPWRGAEHGKQRRHPYWQRG